MSVLEDSWRPGLNEEQVIKCLICSIFCTPNIIRYMHGVLLLVELDKNYQAKKCVRDAIASGILSDGYSGSQVDLVVITKNKTEYLREYDVVCDKGKRIGKYGFKPGTTPIASQNVC